MSRLRLDLHDVYDDGAAIERQLREAMDEAVRIRARSLEIIPGKGSGQLKRRVLRFLDQADVKSLYHRVERDGKNWGRLIVHFRWR